MQEGLVEFGGQTLESKSLRCATKDVQLREAHSSLTPNPTP